MPVNFTQTDWAAGAAEIAVTIEFTGMLWRVRMNGQELRAFSGDARGQLEANDYATKVRSALAVSIRDAVQSTQRAVLEKLDTYIRTLSGQGGADAARGARKLFERWPTQP